MSEVVYRRITWAHRLLVWPIVLLCGVIPVLIYEQEIRLMLRPPPFETLAARGEMRPNGRWRVTFDFNVRERCGSVTWRKSFWFDQDQQPVLLDAVDATLASARPAVQSGGNSKPGPLTFWLEYAPIRGKVGKFVVVGAFSDCPSGNDQLVNLPPVAVDWQ
jgi:hypothetical protein